MQRQIIAQPPRLGAEVAQRRIELAYGFYQWLCIVAVLGFARRWLTADSAARRYLTDAIFPYYIEHQTGSS
jgi:hypothetical protein